jgi:hypothetical protein
MHGANFHTVYMAAEILLVECKPCGRRTMLTKQDAPIRQGNMTELRGIKFRCRCGSTQVRLYVPHSKEEATMWLAGDRLPGREARNDRDPI